MIRPLPSLALGLLLWSGVAHADPKDDARRHFRAALAAAQAKDYQGALDEFLAAQAAWPHPATLYNIARAYTDLGQLDQAIETYQLYQAAAPEHAADVDPIIAVLRARQQQATAPVTPEAAPTATAPASQATAEEVERLRAIAEELAALGDRLATREAPPAEQPSAEGDAPAAVEPPADEAPAAELMGEAYERVVVTASRFGQDPLDSPSAVTILSSEDIRASGASTVPDLLRQVVGVDVMSLSSSQPDVGIRGFNRELSNKVLVLVDGRSVYLDILGTVLWGTLPISLQEIERIEIIRGPASAMYGANAVTGVINIITRAPGEGQSLVHVEGGTPGDGQGVAMVTGRSAGTAWRLSTGAQQLGRWSAEGQVSDDGAMVPFVEDQDHSLQVVRANARIDQKLGADGFGSVSGGYAEGRTELYVFGALGDFALPFRSGFGRADLSWKGVHLRGFSSAFSGSTGPWLQAAGARSMQGDIQSAVHDVELETLRTFETGAVSHHLAAGVGYRIKSTLWDYLEGDEPIVEHHASAFLQEDARIGRLGLVGSMRVDKHPLVPIQHTMSPRGAAILRVAPRTSLRASAGTSFRAPTHMESYLDLAQPTDVDGVYVRTLGDPDLLPERITTFELGVHDESTDWHRADLALFSSTLNDLIFVQDIVPELSPLDPDQAGFAAGSTTFGNLTPTWRALGAEADAHVFPVDGVDVYANASLLRIVEDDGEVVLDRSASPLKVNAGAAWRSPWRVDLAAHVQYASAQTWRLREYDATGALVVQEGEVGARTNVLTWLAVHPTDSVEITASAWNIAALLGGEPHREHPKGQLVGGRAQAGLTWRF